MQKMYRLYMTMFQLIGHLLVKKKKVFELNNKEIEKAAEVLPSITKFLTHIQYYRMAETDETKEDILANWSSECGSDIEESNDQSSQTATTDSRINNINWCRI